MVNIWDNKKSLTDEQFEVQQEEFKKAYENNTIFLVAGFTVYQIHYSQACGVYYVSKVYKHNKCLTARGRCYYENAKTVNEWIGKELFIDFN